MCHAVRRHGAYGRYARVPNRALVADQPRAEVQRWRPRVHSLPPAELGLACDAWLLRLQDEDALCADSLGGFIPGPAENVTDIAEAAFTEGFQTFASALSPWLHLTDQAKFDAHVNAVRQFEPEMILSSHGLVAKGKLDPLLKTLSSVPSMEPFVGPDHDAMIAMMAEAPPAP